MKEKIIEKTKVEITYEYEALDGRIFKDKSECKKYEESAKMVVHSKYQPLVIARKTEYEIFNTGSEEYEIDIVKMSKPEDVDIIIQLWCLYNNKSESQVLEERNKLYDWYTANETILIGRGSSYDNYDSFWFIDTVSNIVNHIIKACNEENV